MTTSAIVSPIYVPSIWKVLSVEDVKQMAFNAVIDKYPDTSCDVAWISYEPRVQPVDNFGHFTIRLDPSRKGESVENLLKQGKTHALQACCEVSWRGIRGIYLVDIRMAALNAHLARLCTNGRDLGGTDYLEFRVDKLRKAKAFTFWEKLA